MNNINFYACEIHNIEKENRTTKGKAFLFFFRTFCHKMKFFDFYDNHFN